MSEKEKHDRKIDAETFITKRNMTFRLTLYMLKRLSNSWRQWILSESTFKHQATYFSVKLFDKSSAKAPVNISHMTAGAKEDFGGMLVQL